MPVLRPLVILVKYFLSWNNANNVKVGGLGSYSVYLMCVSFLQMHPILQMGIMDPDQNLGILLIEFFELYGTCFNYAKVGIRVTGGGAYVKRSRNTDIPEDLGGGVMDDKVATLLCIDPIPIKYSIDPAKKSKNFHLVRHLFAAAKDTLINNLQERIQLKNDRASTAQQGINSSSSNIDIPPKAHAVNGAPELSPELELNLGTSLLQGVFVIPQSVAQFRERISEAFDTGKLVYKPFSRTEGVVKNQLRIKELRNAKKRARESEKGARGSEKRVRVAPSTQSTTMMLVTPESFTSTPDLFDTTRRQNMHMQGTVVDEHIWPKDQNEEWVSEDEDKVLTMDPDVDTPLSELCETLRKFAKNLDLENPENLSLVWQTRRNIIRMVTMTRVRNMEKEQHGIQAPSIKTQLYSRTRRHVDRELRTWLKLKVSEESEMEQTTNVVNEMNEEDEIERQRILAKNAQKGPIGLQMLKVSLELDDHEEAWLTEDDDLLLGTGMDGDTPVNILCEKLLAIASNMDLKKTGNHEDMMQARRKVIRMATLARIRASESQQKRKLETSDKTSIYAWTRKNINKVLAKSLDPNDRANPELRRVMLDGVRSGRKQYRKVHALRKELRELRRRVAPQHNHTGNNQIIALVVPEAVHHGNSGSKVEYIDPKTGLDEDCGGTEASGTEVYVISDDDDD
ncbi:hypothetical protein BG004_001112 [Podila humilis]|nr:hypothetical protein BG004_001112 [Podila humilis]